MKHSYQDERARLEQGKLAGGEGDEGGSVVQHLYAEIHRADDPSHQRYLFIHVHLSTTENTRLVYLLMIINNNHIQRRNSRFFTISSLCRELSPTRTLKWPRRNQVQIMCNTSSAYHVQHVVLCATWYKGTAQLLNLTEFKSHLFELSFISLTIKR